jgi:hypothetical protein
MITAGDVEFEPPMQKIWKLTDSIAVMVAGDLGLHADFWADLWSAVQDRLRNQPAKPWRVRDVAYLYQSLWMDAHAKFAERDLLRPLGLTLGSFIDKQRDMSPDFSRRLADNIRSYPQLEVGVLIAGVDDRGSHLYVVDDGEVSCKDPLGFAAIGVGAVHANSHFMISKHTRFETIARTLLRTYVAKRRSEVAPGVGDSWTDMFVVGPDPNSFNTIPYDLLMPLEQIYREHQHATQIVANETEAKVQRFLDGLAEAAKVQAAQATESMNQPKDLKTGAEAKQEKAQDTKAKPRRKGKGATPTS